MWLQGFFPSCQEQIADVHLAITPQFKYASRNPNDKTYPRRTMEEIALWSPCCHSHCVTQQHKAGWPRTPGAGLCVCPRNCLGRQVIHTVGSCGKHPTQHRRTRSTRISSRIIVNHQCKRFAFQPSFLFGESRVLLCHWIQRDQKHKDNIQPQVPKQKPHRSSAVQPRVSEAASRHGPPRYGP